jgi:hypothetical protein
MIPSFLKTEKVGLREQVIFNGDKLEIFIPDYFLDPDEKMAFIIGEKVKTLGIFWFKHKEKLYEIQIPVKIIFEFSEMYKDSLKLKPSMPLTDYSVFVLKNGDIFMFDTNYKQSVDDFSFGIMDKLIEKAKMPPTVAYNEVMSIFVNALQVTQILDRLGVSAVTFEMMLSELYRNRRNLSTPFRMTFDEKKPYDYKMLRIVKLPELNSTFTGLLGEDIDQQVVSAVLRNRENKKEKESPLEKLIKY